MGIEILKHVHNCLLCQRFNVNAVDVQLIHIPHQRPKLLGGFLRCQFSLSTGVELRNSQGN